MNEIAKNASARILANTRSPRFETFLLIAILLMVWTSAQLWQITRYTQTLSAFFVTLIILQILSQRTVVGELVAAWCLSFANFLDNRGAFRTNIVTEIPKFALIRICFGVFLIQRAFWIIYYATPDDWQNPALITAMALDFLSACMICFGLLTQVAFSYLILIQWQIADKVLGTNTLGNDIAAMLAFLLMIVNAGAHLSVDSLLLKKNCKIGACLKRFYYADGFPPAATVQIAKFLALLSYWCVCIYSLALHLNEPAWMDGTAGPYLLTNNLMSAYAAEINTLLESFPGAVLITRIMLWAMLPWYALIIPFVLFGGIWKSYIIIWAVLFFTLSLFVLQLGHLAHFEFLLLAALFWQSTFIKDVKTFDLAFDDRCNLCDRTVQFIKFSDIFSRVNLRPLSQNKEWLIVKNISLPDARADLYGVDNRQGGKVYSGYELYIALSKQVFLLVPFFPILMLGKSLSIGPSVYRWIADRRTRLFGVCQLNAKKPDYLESKHAENAQRSLTKNDPIVYTCLHVSMMALGFLIAVPAPYLGWHGAASLGVASRIVSQWAESAHIYGIAPINVFNEADLKMAEKWFTLEALRESAQKEFIPIFTPTGHRLAMHSSDRIYFGFTLKFRRRAIYRDGCMYNNFKERIISVARLYAMRSTTKVDSFLYTQYYQPLPAHDGVLRGQWTPNPITVQCTVRFGHLN